MNGPVFVLHSPRAKILPHKSMLLGDLNRMICRYNLYGVNITKEAELVREKRSQLSAAQRKAVLWAEAILEEIRRQRDIVSEALEGKS